MATATLNGSRTGRATIDAQCRKAARWLELKELAKQHYDEADRLEQELIGLIGAGALALDDGRYVTVADNFIDKHGHTKTKAFGICGVKRFELKVK